MDSANLAELAGPDPVPDDLMERLFADTHRQATNPQPKIRTERPDSEWFVVSRDDAHIRSPRIVVND